MQRFRACVSAGARARSRLHVYLLAVRLASINSKPRHSQWGQKKYTREPSLYRNGIAISNRNHSHVERI